MNKSEFLTELTKLSLVNSTKLEELAAQTYWEDLNGLSGILETLSEARKRQFKRQMPSVAELLLLSKQMAIERRNKAIEERRAAERTDGRVGNPKILLFDPRGNKRRGSE